MKSGVYVIRTHKPAARFGWPFFGRHFGYVGESVHIERRLAQHFQGGGQYNSTPKPWADLRPVCVLRIPLPPWKWLLRSVEALLIFMLWPVYNHKGNLWNPRRIPLSTQHRQRAARVERGWSMNFRFAHLVLIVAAVAILWAVCS